MSSFATASENIFRIRAGDLSAEDWMRSCLARVEARDRDVRAWVDYDREALLRQARELDRAQAAGPLHGMPFGVKDVILTEQLPTRYNSPIYPDHHPRVDAGCVKILRAAGAIMFGKTDTVEFAAAKRVAATRNPLDLTRTPGGSSSGSAAAVADGHVPVALGTQTGGSLIRPASYCGVFAMKPTWGLVTRDGVRLYSATLDTVGWYARSVDDLALIYEAFETEPLPAATPSSLDRARIGICRTPFWDRADAGTRRAVEQAEALLRAAGADVRVLELPAEFAALGRDQMVIMRSEGRAAFLPEYRADLDRLNDAFRGMVENTDGFSRTDLLEAYDRAASARSRFDAIAQDFDAILAPSTTGEAPVGLASTGSADFNGIWTLLHAPVINVPGFRGASGMPVGLSLVSGRFCDRRLLAMARPVADLFAGAGG